MTSEYDGIILGTGHNALVMQAYLCRSGLKLLSLDRAHSPGGGLATVQNPRQPGFLHNTHSFFHRGLTAMPWYRDLELERHGACYIEPQLNVAMILQDGRSLQWWTDFEKTYDSFAQFSRRDADTLRQWRVEFQSILREILIPEARSPPLPSADRLQLLNRSVLGRQLLVVSELSPLEFVQREFENDVIRAGLLFFNGLREVDLRQKGFGHSIPALLASDRMAQMCVGGSARLAEALVNDIREHGGEVRVSLKLRSILVRGGRTYGVELSDGEQIEARFVASGLNPQQTFTMLIDEAAAGTALRRHATGYKYNLLAPLFALNLAMSDLPRYFAAASDPSLDDAFMIILGLERFEQFEQIVKAHENGQMPPTVMWGACPTRFDPSQAPPGRHTAFMWEKVPYSIRGNPQAWDELVDEHARQLLQLWATYAPNLNDIVIDSFARTPVVVCRCLACQQFHLLA